MKRAICFVLMLVMVFSLCACGGSANEASSGSGTAAAASSSGEVFNLQMQTCLAAGTPNYMMAEKFVKDVESMSGGRLKIDLYAAGALAEYADMATAVRDGILDLATVSISSQSGLVGKKAYLFGGSGSPGGFNPDEFLAWVYEGGGEATIQKWVEPIGVKVVTVATASGAELFCHSNVKLESVDDFKGVKFRTMGMWADVLTKIGATVVNLSGGDIYQGAEKGIVDAFEYCDAAINYTMGYQDITKYIGVPGIHSPTCAEMLYCNPDVWNSLPADLQAIIYTASKNMAMESPYFFAKLDAEAMEKFKADGIEFFTLSEETQEEFLKVTYELMCQYMEEEEGYKEIVEDQKAFLDQYKANDRAVQITISTYDYDIP